MVSPQNSRRECRWSRRSSGCPSSRLTREWVTEPQPWFYSTTFQIHSGASYFVRQRPRFCVYFVRCGRLHFRSGPNVTERSLANGAERYPQLNFDALLIFRKLMDRSNPANQQPLSLVSGALTREGDSTCNEPRCVHHTCLVATVGANLCPEGHDSPGTTDLRLLRHQPSVRSKSTAAMPPISEAMLSRLEQERKCRHR